MFNEILKNGERLFSHYSLFNIIYILRSIKTTYPFLLVFSSVWALVCGGRCQQVFVRIRSLP